MKVIRFPSEFHCVCVYFVYVLVILVVAIFVELVVNPAIVEDISETGSISFRKSLPGHPQGLSL